ARAQRAQGSLERAFRCLRGAGRYACPCGVDPLPRPRGRGKASTGRWRDRAGVFPARSAAAPDRVPRPSGSAEGFAPDESGEESMSVRILHLADLHLGAAFPSMGERAQERTRDLLNAFLRAIEFASSPKHPVDLVAIAGDLFDTHDPDEGLVFQVESSFERLSKAKVPVFLVPGTHDAYSYR